MRWLNPAKHVSFKMKKFFDHIKWPSDLSGIKNFNKKHI